LRVQSSKLDYKGAEIGLASAWDMFWLYDIIQSGNYQQTSALLELWAQGTQLYAQPAQHSQLNAEFPMFASALFQKAMKASFGRNEVSTLFKVMG
jgi:hypothetical protein